MAVVDSTEGKARVVCGAGRARGGNLRLATLGLALVGGFASFGTGCVGPGLEPPWSDDDSANRASADTGGGALPPPNTTPSVGGSGSSGDFGNTTGGAAGMNAATGGTTASPPTVTPPSGSAGAGTVEPPPTTTEPDPTMLAGAGGDSGAAGSGAGSPSSVTGVDFVPECTTEVPFVLTSTEACRYPLPEGVTLDSATLQVATLEASTPTLLQGGQSALSCLLGNDYYVDASTMPAAIVLCSATCSALASSAQVVAIDGCPATMP